MTINILTYYFFFIERYKELQMLLNEFRMPIVRIERNLETLIDGLEGESCFPVIMYGVFN